ncbi:histidine phosphatase family protein (plasmid) [Streptomyces sp. BI20]|uniref:histidine phosphatase family protein n=1 Tax=Streptomyces sp. BI20 TaxID=3403460 RepID=UPI003C745708
MTLRVRLISPAWSEAGREARFDDEGPLDPRGLADARAAADELGAAPGAVYASPSRRCRETAEALGPAEVVVADVWAGCAMGRWRGRTLTELAGAEPEAVARWLADPAAAPHGGESVRELRARIGGVLDAAAGREAGGAGGRLVAVVEPDVVRAAVLHALALPDETFWRLDVRPLTVTELVGRAGRWNLLLGRAAGA